MFGMGKRKSGELVGGIGAVLGATVLETVRTQDIAGWLACWQSHWMMCSAACILLLVACLETIDTILVLRIAWSRVHISR